MSHQEISIGSMAPDFELVNQNGAKVRLSALRGQPVVVFFYPRDRSPVCSLEIAYFREQHADFTKHGAVVLGVSNDSMESHASLCSDENLPFSLLTDIDNQTLKLYQPSGLMGRVARRMTFVIDKEGIVQEIIRANLRAKVHVDRSLEYLENKKQA